MITTSERDLPQTGQTPCSFLNNPDETLNDLLLSNPAILSGDGRNAIASRTKFFSGNVLVYDIQEEWLRISKSFPEIQQRSYIRPAMNWAAS